MNAYNDLRAHKGVHKFDYYTPRDYSDSWLEGSHGFSIDIDNYVVRFFFDTPSQLPVMLIDNGDVNTPLTHFPFDENDLDHTYDLIHSIGSFGLENDKLLINELAKRSGRVLRL